MRESVAFFKEIGVTPVTFFALQFPGTRLYEMALERGRIKDELAYMMGLDQMTILNPQAINLTDMDDETEARVLMEAVHEIETHYARQVFQKIRLGTLSSKLRHSVAKQGLKGTVAEGWRLLRHALR